MEVSVGYGKCPIYDGNRLQYKDSIMGRKNWHRGLGRATAFVAGLVFAGAAAPAWAEPLKVLLDKAIILRLDQPATVVVVGSPEIADVSVENPNLLFITGKAAGETNLLLLDDNGNQLGNYDLVVVSELARHVTVNRNTAVLTTYSCDPRCIEVSNPSDIERQRQFAAGPSQGDQGSTSTGPAGPAAPPPSPATADKETIPTPLR